MRWLLVLLLALPLIGCKREPSLVGQWECNDGLVAGRPGTMNLTFAEDGTVTTLINITESKDMTVMSTDKGKWKLEGDKLTLIWTDINRKFGGRGAELNQMEFDRNREKILQDVNKNPTANFAWIGDDSFKTTEPDGLIQTFRRAG
jgi:hypothetical protein